MSASDVDRISERPASASTLLDYVVATPVPIAAAGYLAWITEASGAGFFALASIFWAMALVAVRMSACPNTIRASAGKESIDEAPDADQTSPGRDALAVVGRLPSRRQRLCFWLGLLPVALVPPLLWLIADGGWSEASRFRSLLLVSVVSAAFSSSVMFYWTRRALAPVRLALAESQTGRARRESIGSLAARVQVAVAVPAIAGLVLAVDMTSHSIRADAEAAALPWLASVVEEIAPTDGSRPLAERIEQVLPPEEYWAHPTHVFEVISDRPIASELGEGSNEFLAELDRQLQGAESRGLIVPRLGPEIGAFSKLEDGRIIIASVRRSDLPDGAGVFGQGLVGVVLLVGIGSILLGALVSNEMARSLEGLRDEAGRLASGDLRGVGLDLTADEFGEIAQSLSSARDSFRTNLRRTSQAAARVDQTIGGLSSALTGILGASGDQARRVEEASQLMNAIQAQVGAASSSADHLNRSIDESGESVLELGSAGDELNETASVLTSKVDAVSNSLEQMVASVKQVGATTGRLAQASEETSSSMEEMASAMRAVDTAAETTANLSRDVVEKAEVGQAKVVQTIAGMEAIREATDTAERVIRGLGARTNEIGGILDVIEDVADETNLLALNAAIIAAQAGEQGKAFSVVADEIKELADRVLASTKEIGGLIRAVQEESENAIGAIEAGSESVMSGVDLSAEAGRTLEEITDASRESGTRISEIVTSVREQTKAASHVVELMERVRESADQIGAAGTEQDRGNEIVYRSALTMREVAQQVHRTTEDQAAGFGRIRESVAGVRGAVEAISGILREQSDACVEVNTCLDGVVAGSRSNEAAAEGVRAAIAALAEQAEGLREDVDRFRC